MIKERFLEQINTLPDKSGVYLMRDSSKNVIYDGKAKNLKIELVHILVIYKSLTLRLKY